MGAQEPAGKSVPFDTNVAHIARVYDYWLGGKDNYAADRAAAEQVIATFPMCWSASARSGRSSAGRCTTWWPRRASGSSWTSAPACRRRTTPTRSPSGGAGVPGGVRGQRPDRAAHARALLTSSPEGATAYIDADLRDTGKILDEAAGVLDFSQPVAVMLLGVLHCIPDEDDPAAIVARLMAAVPAGSYLVIAHPASDVPPSELSRSMGDYNKQAAAPVTARSHAEVCRFFAAWTWSSRASSSCTGGGLEPRRRGRAAS